MIVFLHDFPLEERKKDVLDGCRNWLGKYTSILWMKTEEGKLRRGWSRMA